MWWVCTQQIFCSPAASLKGAQFWLTSSKFGKEVVLQVVMSCMQPEAEHFYFFFTSPPPPKKKKEREILLVFLAQSTTRDYYIRAEGDFQREIHIPERTSKAEV